MAEFNVEFHSLPETFDLDFNGDQAFSLDMELPFIGVLPDPYEGEYNFTPTESQQIVQIANQTASQNITIEPIPSDYGKITWDGSTLTVS